MSIHEISFRGTAGSMFVALCASAVFYVVAYFTTEWSEQGIAIYGVWKQCTCANHSTTDESWYKAFQAFATISLIGLGVSFILVSLYFCVHFINKNVNLIALMIALIATTLCILITLIIYGTKKEGSLAWSYGVAVVGGILCLVSAVFTGLQIRASGAAQST